MKVLVLGTGGREHAIAWKIRQSPACERVYLHPGNAGTAVAGFPTFDNIAIDDLSALTKHAQDIGIGLVVIGPEALLEKGYADAFRKAGFPVVGPNQAAAQLETSKVFAKEFMRRAKVPTADFFVIDNFQEMLALKETRRSWPVVLKLDGLAAGKGVVIAENTRDIENFADRIWQQNEFGRGQHKVVVEEFIEGKELSYIGLCDGSTFVPLATATDFKRVGDHNTGPNTGGMGSISPSPYFSAELETKIKKDILGPVLNQLAKDGLDYRGALYIGLMIDAQGCPHVVEFNARFGDPETQAVLLRLQTDFIDLLVHTADATLIQSVSPEWTPGVSVYVVAAAEGYPANPRRGDPITGLELVERSTQVFFSGVSGSGDSLMTNGGRVLGLGTTGPDFAVVRDQIYRDLRRVDWQGIHYRKDIGA